MLLLAPSVVWLFSFAIFSSHAEEMEESEEAVERPLSIPETVLSWKSIDFKYESLEMKQKFEAVEGFDHKNNVIAGIKVMNNRVFLSVPRWRPAIPATLAYVEQGTGEEKEKLLIPYPSWQMQELGNCEAFQYVQSMEIDQFGRMWVLDVGRELTGATGPELCPPKLTIIDLEKDKILWRYDFPREVVSWTRNFLNDLVVGCTTMEKCWAYITDAAEAKIIVYNYGENKSWSVQHPSMNADSNALNLNILEINYTINSNVNGIALSPLDKGFDILYYCAISSFEIYTVETKYLKESIEGGSSLELKDEEIKKIGKKSSQSAGLAMDSKGLLLYGLLGENSVRFFNTSHHEQLDGKTTTLLIQNNIEMQWPDTFAFDEIGYLYVTTNRLQRFITNTYDFQDSNFRVIRVYLGSKSYMHSANEDVKGKMSESQTEGNVFMRGKSDSSREVKKTHYDLSSHDPSESSTDSSSTEVEKVSRYEAERRGNKPFEPKDQLHHRMEGPNSLSPVLKPYIYLSFTFSFLLLFNLNY